MSKKFKNFWKGIKRASEVVEGETIKVQGKHWRVTNIRKGSGGGRFTLQFSLVDDATGNKTTAIYDHNNNIITE